MQRRVARVTRVLVERGGRLGWYTGPTWLTGRHLGKINMSAVDGSVRRVSTAKQLSTRILGFWRSPNDLGLGDCLGRNRIAGTNRYSYSCLLCAWGTFMALRHSAQLLPSPKRAHDRGRRRPLPSPAEPGPSMASSRHRL